MCFVINEPVYFTNSTQIQGGSLLFRDRDAEHEVARRHHQNVNFLNFLEDGEGVFSERLGDGDLFLFLGDGEGELNTEAFKRP